MLGSSWKPIVAMVRHWPTSTPSWSVTRAGLVGRVLWRHRDRDVDAGAVLAQAHRLEMFDPFAVPDGFENRLELACTVGRHDQRHPAAEHLRRRPAVHPLSGRVPAQDGGESEPRRGVGWSVAYPTVIGIDSDRLASMRMRAIISPCATVPSVTERSHTIPG
jgi:hypothetical protein